MDPEAIGAMFRFNTWANEQIRGPISSADPAVIQRPLDFWFGSVFKILSHIYSAEALWLARLSDTSNAQSAAEPQSVPELVELWRSMDQRWESYVGSLSAADLVTPLTVPRRDGSSAVYETWQPVMQIAFHGTEHRGHATVALTQLGITHGPQDFIVQFREPAAP